MSNPLAALAAHVDALGGEWVGALPAGGGVRGDLQSEVERMSDAGLVRVTDAVAQVRRDTEALLARVADEVARRSRSEFGSEGLAKQQGFHNPARLVASSTGGSTGDAMRLLSVGAATRERESFSGERMPAKHPSVAAAVGSGSISLDAASAITSMLERVALRADPEAMRGVEATLVSHAASLPLAMLQRAIRQAEAMLDQDGVAPREEELRQQRGITLREGRDGMVHVSGRLDPETAAPVKAALESLVSDALRRRRGGAGAAAADASGLANVSAAFTGGDASGECAGDDSAFANVALANADGAAPAIDDHRTIPQLQADALADLARHCLGCRDTLPPLAKTTAVVRVDLETLREGLGVATIDGIDQPVSAATARRMAADAELIPAVLGGDSVPLDLGRAARLFTKEQRLALGERDGGCASCGQNISYVEAHHIRWWERDAGPTDLNNGVLLCSFCHHRVHDDGWTITVRDGTVWFTPPPHADPTLTPRLGGRARFEVRLDAAA
ncbi:HNH endonuclease [Agromyces rhizosphaerae]|uniref:HNH endonuclease n=1 Tax=Agromyces rhizosphaerae TaxID=88374 RepID=A0A9W6FQ94_9MICO|nr:HNH endonuclease signature motif containing protein [Agromyces rhizosphaerae]GLI28290.1 HNH endonuclease [Agromyces rhizosphaerae]